MKIFLTSLSTKTSLSTETSLVLSQPKHLWDPSQDKILFSLLILFLIAQMSFIKRTLDQSK